jgi:SAM-dependent methyltransferase
MTNEKKDIETLRARVREIASEHYKRGDVLGWFDALYQEADGDNEIIPWADLEPNRYFRSFAESTGLKGEGRTALVVGCGLGDDAKYLLDLGFEVTAFDISPTAIDWAKRLHADTDIEFHTADLFEPPATWRAAFDFVLEIYTIQPLPIEMRPDVVDAIASFVADNGTLVVVTRGREDDEEPDELPWPMSRRDLSRFDHNGLTQTAFHQMPGEEGEPDRFVVEYKRK